MKIFKNSDGSWNYKLLLIILGFCFLIYGMILNILDTLKVIL